MTENLRLRRTPHLKKQGDSLVFDKMDLMRTIGMLQPPPSQAQPQEQNVDDKINNLLERLDKIQQRSPAKAGLVQSSADQVEVITSSSDRPENRFSLTQNLVPTATDR